MFQDCKGVPLVRGVRNPSRSLPDMSRVVPSEISRFEIFA